MKKYFIIALVGIVMLAVIDTLHKQKQRLAAENERLMNNLEYYSSFGARNIVLQSTVDELKHSNDSLVRNIWALQKKLKLSEDDTNTVVYVETVLNDTLRDTIVSDRDFHTVVKPNDMTSIEVVRQDTLLQVIPDIRNSQTLFIQTEKHYKYRTFWKRLIHFNFKKVSTDTYTIHNGNDLIKTGDTRVINLIH